MIDEAKEDDIASQGAKKQRNACMQWPPHPTATRGKEMGHRPLSRPETQSSSAVDLGRNLWRADGSSGCNASEKIGKKTKPSSATVE